MDEEIAPAVEESQAGGAPITAQPQPALAGPIAQSPARASASVRQGAPRAWTTPEEVALVQLADSLPTPTWGEVAARLAELCPVPAGRPARTRKQCSDKYGKMITRQKAISSRSLRTSSTTSSSPVAPAAHTPSSFLPSHYADYSPGQQFTSDDEEEPLEPSITPPITRATRAARRSTRYVDDIEDPEVLRQLSEIPSENGVEEEEDEEEEGLSTTTKTFSGPKTFSGSWTIEQVDQLFNKAADYFSRGGHPPIPKVEWERIAAALEPRRSFDATHSKYRTEIKKGRRQTPLLRQPDTVVLQRLYSPVEAVRPSNASLNAAGRTFVKMETPQQNASPRVDPAVRRPRITPVISIRQQPFTAEDDQALLSLYREVGGFFKLISRRMTPQRHKKEVKARLQQLLAPPDPVAPSPIPRYFEGPKIESPDRATPGKRRLSHSPSDLIDHSAKRARSASADLSGELCSQSIDISTLSRTIIKQWALAKRQARQEKQARRPSIVDGAHHGGEPSAGLVSLNCSSVQHVGQTPLPRAPSSSASPCVSPPLSQASCSNSTSATSDVDPCDAFCECKEPKSAPSGSIQEMMDALRQLERPWKSFL